ncbi:MAG: sulfatase-like hydrolase/transferase [Gemmatimonadaceae bacterium]|nr:sulfatase-like hydrolase/transferase [Gemmatimonadaceae bacterium]
MFDPDASSARPAATATPGTTGTAVQPPSARELLSIAWGLALAAGVAYALTQFVRQRVLHELAFVSRDVWWMSPIAHLMIFAPLALVFALVLRGRPRGRVVAFATFAFLAVISQLLPYTAIASWAQVILAAGVAVQLARWYSQASPARRGALGTATRVATVGVVALALTQQGWRVERRHSMLAALPVAADGAPNVLLLILDTVRSDNLSLYGHHRPTTPNLLRRSAEATVFEQAFATAPWTLPSHGSLLTGRYASELPHDWLRPINLEGETVAERFRDSGYLTAGFVANLSYTSYETGLARGFIEYHDYPLDPRLILKHSPLALSGAVQQVARIRSMDDARRAVSRLRLAPGGHAGWHPVPAQDVTNRFLAFERKRGARPFFAFLNYMNAHDPYRAPDSVLARFGDGRRPVDRYDAAIARLDEEIGRLLDSLQRRGALDNTIVVVTADHGELFGEHGLRGHANALYRPLLQVPLFVRYPARVPRGARVQDEVSLRDIPATLLDLAGIARGTIPGQSLACTWTPQADGVPSPAVASVIQGRNVSARFPNAATPLATVIDDDQQLIRNARGEEQLLNYREDPTEVVNEVQDPQVRSEVARLRAILASVAHGR